VHLRWLSGEDGGDKWYTLGRGELPEAVETSLTDVCIREVNYSLLLRKTSRFAGKDGGFSGVIRFCVLDWDETTLLADYEACVLTQVGLHLVMCHAMRLIMGLCFFSLQLLIAWLMILHAQHPAFRPVVYWEARRRL
jgi:hypothetical protein